MQVEPEAQRNLNAVIEQDKRGERRNEREEEESVYVRRLREGACQSVIAVQ